MRKFISTIGAASAALVALAQPAMAAEPPILSLNLFRGDSNGNCADTVPGSGCSPIGVTAAGGLSNPFLNNTGNKEISLAPGSYYLFGNPWAGTEFMTQGSAISVFLRLSTGDNPVGHSLLLIGNSKVPDLSIAGQTIFDFEPYGIKISTTGITNADRVSFGYPPAAFAADGREDFVLLLTYGVTSAVPEPAAWGMMIAGMGFAGAALRRRKASVRFA
jgi:hypothetical protein